jgi:hypothetical protein
VDVVLFRQNQKDMKKNITSTDRIIRILVFVVAAILYFTHVLAGIAGILLFGIGTILLLTALINFCPIYWALGLKKPTNQV